MSARLKLVVSRDEPSRAELAASRGFQPVYVRGQRNVCPGCGNSGWYISDRGPGVRAECSNEDYLMILPVESGGE